MSLLGVHVASGKRRGIDGILKAGPAVVVMCDQNLIADAKAAGAVTVFRTKQSALGEDTPQGINEASLEQMPQMAHDWIASLLPIWQHNPGADFYQDINEWGTDSIVQCKKVNAFELAAMQKADSIGYKLAILSEAGGSPSDDGGITAEQRWAELLPAVRYAGQHGHAVCLHIHPVNHGPLTETGEDIAYRHERVFRIWEAAGVNPMPRVIFGELSNGVGGVEPNLADFMVQITAWDEHVMRSKYRDVVLGAALYGYNEKESIATAAGRIATWIADHPTPTDPIDPEVPPTEPELWDKVVVLVPQGIHQGIYQTVTSQLGYPTRTEVAFSAHSAFAPQLHARSHKVIVVNAAQWGGGPALLAWVQAQFGKLPDEVEYREFQ
jgi:hypothetical protein